MDEVLAPKFQEERRALREALGRVGVWSFTLEAQTAVEEADAAREIESLGFAAIWVPEAVDSREIFSHAAWLLASTESVTIASGIASIWARDAVATANGWRMLTDAYPRRFVLGLGVSHAGSVARRGSNYDRPYSEMRRYLDAIERAGSSAPEPDAEPMLVLAALGPRMLRLAAERALGAHPYFVPIEHTTLAREALGAGPVLAPEQAIVLSQDPDVARQAARRHMKRYLDLENYANNLRRLGWADADLAEGGSDKLVDAIVAWGDDSTIKARVREHDRRGADHVCLQVLRPDPKAAPGPDLERAARALLS